MQGAKRAVAEAKSHCGKGSRPAKAMAKPHPLFGSQKPSTSSASSVVCMGWGLAKSHRSRQKPSGSSAMSGDGGEPAEF